MRHAVLLSFALPLLFLGGCKDDSPASNALTIKGDVAECDVEFENTGVVLSGNLSGTIPDPGNRVVRDARGFYYSTTFAGGAIAEWSPSGTFVRSFGHEGRGPGEIELGPASLYLDASGNINIRDNALAWSTFDSAGKFIRRTAATSLGPWDLDTHFLDDGSVLTSSVFAPRRKAYFHVFDREGNYIRAFGDLNAEDIRLFEGRELDRPSTYAGGSTFWTAARKGSSLGYTLEQWTVTGERLRAIVREVEWFQPQSKAEARRYPPDYDKPPPPHIRMIHEDSSGLLLVYVAVPTSAWIPSERRGVRSASGMYEYHYELIDPDKGRLVASRVTTSEATLPMRFFRSSSVGFVREDPGNGLERLVLVRYRVVQRKAAERGTHTACGAYQR